MGAIRILPDRVANQIAAGEVVERPASIVKELVENALDAGATRVEIEFRHGGRSFIRIEDNGTGMSRDDALLSLERHATSKIREAGDLDRVVSFGFRGEALPSIASVSRFTMQTREAACESGTEILVNGGKVVHVRDCGMPVGTRIVVANLFNSVPARRKFLKSEATEAAHIVQASRLYALANPGVSVTLIESGRTIFQSPVCASLAERVGEVFGRQLATGLVPLEAVDGETRLTGLISRPGVVRATRHEMVTFVNRRPVDSRTLAYAILESYHTLLPKGRYPLAFLFLDISPASVDVNVHPAKREVRFRDEVRVRSFTIRAVLETLRSIRDETARSAGTDTSRAPSDVASKVGAASSAPVKSVPAAPQSVVPARVGKPPAAPDPPPSAPRVAQPVETPDTAPAHPESRRPTTATTGWRLMGEFSGTYSVFESAGGGLIVLDRVAAAERVWFERLRSQGEDEAVQSQRLLLPVPLELDSVSAAMLVDASELLSANGWEISPFGRDFFRIEAIPIWEDPGSAEAFVREVIGQIRLGRLDTRQSKRAQEELARTAAARLGAGATAKLAPLALEQLVADLLRCENPHSAPGGRPTFVEIAPGELARRFHKSPVARTVAED